MSISTTSLGRKICRLLLIIAVGLVLLSGSRMWTKARASASGDFNIYLASTTFDPVDYVPPAPGGLAVTSEQAAQAGLYLLQFNGPVQDDWKQQLLSAGAQLGPYIPQYAFVVKMDPAALALVQGLSFVRWVGPFQPGYKLSPDIDRTLTRSYNVTLAPWADALRMSSLARSLDSGAQTFTQDILVVLDSAQLDQLAFQPDVMWIEPYYLKQINNNVGGGTIMNGSTAWANGYTGAGVTVAVMDTGLDTGNPATMHLDFMNGSTPRVTHISSWPVLSYSDGTCSVANVGANDGAADLESGHGTHVTGSVAGNGARSSGTFKGLAYEAAITFQAVEQYVTFNSSCSGSNGYYLMGIPDDVRPLFTEVYNWGARVQNDSWGGGTAGVYDQQAAYFDDFIFNHPDFAIVVAAGNSGKDLNADGYVDNGSVNSPGTAKNVINVGATESERTSSSCNPNSSSGYSGCTYNYLWGSSFPAFPTGSDVISDNRGQMAAFSSRGPAADGRMRPDVAAPGTDIISTRSSQASETGWGAYNSYYESMGGTSMASPLTAGAAALVREFLINHESIANPSAALIKATLINTAVDIPGYRNTSYEAGAPIPNNSEGWGRVDVGAATSPGRKFMDGATLTTGASFDKTYTVATGAPFKVTLAWSDYPAAASAGVTLVNDLNLKVTAPDGTTTYLGNVFSGGWSATGGIADNRNNVENVYVQNPGAGVWHVQVIGQNIPHNPQPYAVVVSGNFTTVEARNKVYLPLISHNFPLPPPGNFNKNTPANGAGGQPVNPTLSWGTSSNATSYTYCLDKDTNSTCESSWHPVGANTSKVVDSLDPSSSYSWQVRASNATGSVDANSGIWWKFNTSAPAAWSTILTENFEGSFPNVWQLSNTAGYDWGKRNCRPFAGSYSGWGVGGGTHGAALGCGSNYPLSSDSWMYYGPFSLADATAADLTFQLWLNSEINYDTVCSYASINGSKYYGNCTSGNTNGWTPRVFDLSNVYNLGNLMGDSNVWIALVFTSDGSTTYPEGGYVDNIVLRKCAAALCTSGSAAANSNSSRLIVVPSEKTIPKK